MLTRHHAISLCHVRDRADLVAFIDEQWKRGHILSVSPQLMDWQHQDAARDGLNFVIARHRESGRLDGALGFIPTSQFDPALAGEGDIWLCIWKVRVDADEPGLGMSLFWFLQRLLQPRSIAGIGMPEGFEKLYRYLGFRVGQLDHYYFVNETKREFVILGNVRAPFEHVPREVRDRESPEREVRLEICTEGRFSALTTGCSDFGDAACYPRKSVTYLRKRYFEHPIYRYAVYAVIRGGGAKGFLVFRECALGGASALRLVDVQLPLGELTGLSSELQRVVQERGAEYCDFYVHGIPEEVVTRVGFVRRTCDSDVIVPNYFEPFEQRNVELRYACLTSKQGAFVICKGDSDQDRPSALPAQGEV